MRMDLLKGLSMMISKSYLIFIVLFCSKLFSIAQQLPKIIPPSPEAASLGKYGDIQVGPYTGSPNISIPIYTIQIRDASLPINLNYHASGIKVEEEASWVGLGWTLQSGGVITRTVRGLDDLLDGIAAKGYVYSNQAVTDQPTKTYLNDVCYKRIDSEPDVFYFNFAGSSGKFYLSRKEESPSGKIQARLLSNNEKIRISYDESNSKWTIWTKDGTQYVFGTKEYTKTWIGSGSGTIVYTAPSTEETQKKIISSWYLDRIISPTREEISFVYTDANATDGKKIMSRGIPSVSEIRSFCVGLRNSGTFNPCPLLNSSFNALYGNKFGFIESKPGYSSFFDFSCIYNNTTTWQWHNVTQGGGNVGSACVNSAPFFSGSFQVYESVFLSEINFSTGRIKFNTSEREDIQAHTDENAVLFAKPKKLESISVEQNMNEVYVPIKNIAFNYSYFNIGPPNTSEPYLDKRLKLLSIQESNGSQSIPPYSFQYEESQNLPKKNSKSRDHWGYFNGAYNEQSGFARQPTIIPTIKYIDQEGKLTGFPGADREANESKSMANILKKITYPTKGSTEFTFESNTFNIDQVPSTRPIVNGGASVDSEYTNTSATVFDLTEQTIVNFSAEFKCKGLACYPFGTPRDPSVDCVNTINGSNHDMYYVKVTNLTTGVVAWGGKYWDFYCKSGISSCINPNEISVSMCGISKIASLTLPAGKYLFKVSAPTGFTANAIADFNLSQQVTSYSNVIVKGGGLRVREVVEKDAVSSRNDKVRKYKYSVTESSGLVRSTGKLMSFPKYANGEYYQAAELNGDLTLLVFLRTHSYSNIPLGSSAQGNAIGYDRVEELIGRNGENGKNIYYYKNQPDEERSPFVPNSPTITHSPSNGLLTSQQVFDANGRIVKEIANSYEVQTDPSALRGVLMINHSGACYTDDTPRENWFYAYTTYSEPSEWWRLTQSTEKTYDMSDPANIRNIGTVKDYTHDTDLKLVTRTTTRDSKENEIIIDTKYPKHEPTLVDSRMWDDSQADYRHMHSYVIKTETFVNGNRIDGTVNKYGFDSNNNLILQTKIDHAVGTNNYESRINFDRYDAKGNVLQMSKSSDLPTSFIWGYNRSLPIAKVTNATYSQIEAALTAQDLIDLGNNSLTSSQIKSKLSTLFTALPKAQISIYTYEPLAGNTSVVDENGIEKKFEYDDLKRLIGFIDQDLQPIIKYKYQFKQD
jgi:hypothetical protein